MKQLIASALILAIAVSGTPLASAAGIPKVEWNRISDKDTSPDGRAALAGGGRPWSHAETDHFVYHFTDEKEAQTVYVHAEVYYKWIKDFFGIASDRWSRKSHIFIFTDEKAWKDFLMRTRQKGTQAAFTSGWELFIYRAPHWVSPRMSLAHEMTHVIAFRFLNGPLPLFLNEGFAEFVSYRLVNMQLEHGGYELPPLKAIPEKDYIPLAELSATDSYPEDRMRAFYEESHLLVRFLISAYGKDRFYELLRRAAKGEEFKKTVRALYGTGPEALEKNFKSSAMAEGR